MSALGPIQRAALALSVLATVALAGCVHGEGPVVSEPREVRPFSRIEVGAGIHVIVRTGLAGVEVRAQSNVVPEIATEVSGATLHIDARSDFTTTEPVTVTISSPMIEGLSMDGGASAEVNGFDGENLELSIRGGASASVSGAVGSVTLLADGGSSVDLTELAAATVSVELGGGATAAVTATELVNGSATAGARLEVAGSPRIEVTTSGGAVVAGG